MKSIQSSIRVDPEILSGTPVFDGTRVPVQTLMDYLKVGDRVDDFLDDFPTVSREQIAAVLDVAGEAVRSQANSCVIGPRVSTTAFAGRGNRIRLGAASLGSHGKVKLFGALGRGD
jgi:uncharacterized protein (DUF433 family)